MQEERERERKVREWAEMDYTHERNSSWVRLPRLLVSNLPENIAENFLSNAIRSCAYLRRSNSYCSGLVRI